jgi:hypothetical protein
MKAERKETGAAQKFRLTVRTISAMNHQVRYRAGLGPFGRDPIVVEVDPWQAEQLRADPMLVVGEPTE